MATASTSASTTGGVVICVAPNYMQRFTAAHEVILVPGRVIALELDSELLERNIVIVAVHIQAGDGWTWASIAQCISDYICSLPAVSFVLMGGDFNVDLDVCDRVCLNNATMCGKQGHRTHLWRSLFPVERWTDLVGGYSHISKATSKASSLDRFFVRAPLPVILHLGGMAKLTVHGKPPCGGDHFPVALAWHKRTSPGRIVVARWMEEHPGWKQA
eukprot:3904674-Amphidinium_carterae.1